MIVPLAVVEVDPPKRFSLRWCHTGPDLSGESLLVTFGLIPRGAGTTIRMTETGFREMGWEIAVLEEQYRDHEEGWDRRLPDLGDYVARLQPVSTEIDDALWSAIGAPLDEVYRAVSTPEGIAGWWTTDTTGHSEVGGQLSFRFGDVGGFEMEVLELEPSGHIRWQVTDGPEEWVGTEIDWRLDQRNEYTVVQFKHEGWREPGRVHAPLQHEVGDLPNEPQRDGGNRGRPAWLRTTSGSGTDPGTSRLKGRLVPEHASGQRVTS